MYIEKDNEKEGNEMRSMFEFVFDSRSLPNRSAAEAATKCAEPYMEREPTYTYTYTSWVEIDKNQLYTFL